METIHLGGGCFWCIEGGLLGLRGVHEVVPGYSGGHLENPTYEQVCGKRTGHAEVVRVTFDPDVIPRPVLLRVFHTLFDPTQLNRQGNDVGPQYRSIVLYSSEEQKGDALAAIEEATLVVQVNGKVRDRIGVPAEISEESAKAVAMSSEKVRAFVDGRDVIKVMFVPGRYLVSVVVKG